MPAQDRKPPSNVTKQRSSPPPDLLLSPPPSPLFSPPPPVKPPPVEPPPVEPPPVEPPPVKPPPVEPPPFEPPPDEPPFTTFDVPPGWKALWSDEFDGGLEKWTPEEGNGQGGWGNQEREYYTGRPENVRTENGVLLITTRREDYGGMPFTSARIKTQGKVGVIAAGTHEDCVCGTGSTNPCTMELSLSANSTARKAAP
jgi:hypothetical protein